MKLKLLLFLIFVIVKVQSQCLKECCQTLKARPKQTYTYYQDSGHFLGGTGDYTVNTHGYSGQGSGYMNPKMQCVQNTGPLPANSYTLNSCQNTMHDPPVTRPCSFYLAPNDESKMCGRGAFFVHGCQCCTNGDFTVPPIGGCSAGCVVISQPNRLKLRIGDQLIVKNYEPKACKVMGGLFKPDCLTNCCSTLKNRNQQTYVFYQDTGHFIGGSDEWTINTYGYSGQGLGYLNPSMNCVEDGPLPVNIYTVGYCKDMMHYTVTRPCSFYLSPNDQSRMCGRKDFFIHGCQCCTDGDFSVPPINGCSAGCIVIAQPNRLKIRLGDKIIVKNYEPKFCKLNSVVGQFCKFLNLRA